MTIQTEIVGEPVEIVTIVDFRGRVLKRWTHPLTFDCDDAELTSVVRDWHAEHEAVVRGNLAKVARRGRERPALGEATSRLFAAGMRAYATRDFETARAAWRGCARMLPDDPRVAAALARVEA